MGEDCAVHKQLLENADKEISALKLKVNMERDKMIAISERQLRIEADVGYIKNKLDNGFGTQLADIYKTIHENVVPCVKENSDWIGRMKTAVVTITSISVVGGIVSFLFFVIKRAFIGAL
jgi:hypothetical protein